MNEGFHFKSINPSQLCNEFEGFVYCSLNLCSQPGLPTGITWEFQKHDSWAPHPQPSSQGGQRPGILKAS